MEAIREAAIMQKEYQRLVDQEILSKKDLCTLCIPFRDKHGLTDLETMRIARREIDLMELIDLLEPETVKPKKLSWTSVEDGKPKTPVDKKGYLCRCVIKDAEEYPFYMVLSYIAVDKNPHFQHEGANMRVTHWAEFNGLVENEKEEKMK